MANNDQSVTIAFNATGDAVVTLVSRLTGGLDTLARSSALAERGLNRLSQSFTGMGQVSAAAAGKIANGYSASQRAMEATTLTANQFATTLNRVRSSTSAATNALAGMRTQTAAVVKVKQQATREANNLGLSLKTVAQQGAAMAGVTVGIATIGNELRMIVSTAADFEEAMAAVGAVGGVEAGSSTFRSLEAAAERVGDTTKFSGTQAAQGLRELVAAGMSAKESTTALADVVDLSIAGEMDMARASEIVVASLTAFKLEAESTARVTDVLARAANASPASVNDLGESLKFVAPIAQALKAPIEDIGAALAILANSGIKGGNAGRGLSSVMAKLVAPTAEAKSMLDSLGISLESINPSIVGMERAMAQLSKMNQQTLVRMFGVENLDIANVLASNADRMGEFRQAMSDSTITARGMAKAMSDTLKGDMQEASSAIEAVRKAIGNLFKGDLRSRVQGFTEWLRENQQAIVGVADTMRDLAPVVVTVLGHYVAFKGLAMGLTLGRQAVAWALETAAVVRNTASIMANANARRYMMQVGMFNAGIPMGVATALTSNVSSLFAAAFGGGATIAAVKAGLTLVGSSAIAAIIGWGLGSYIESQFKIGDRVAAAVFKTFDSLNAAADDSIKTVQGMIDAAKTEEQLGEARVRGERELAKWKEISNRAEDESKTLAETVVQTLQRRMELADRTFARNQANLAQQREGAALAEEELKSKQVALYHEEKAIALRKSQLDMEKSTRRNAVGVNRNLLERSDAGTKEAAYDAEERRITSLANHYRTRFNAVAAAAGVTVINGDREIRTVDGVIAYFRAAMRAAGETGSAAVRGDASLHILTRFAQSADAIIQARTKLNETVAKDEKAEENALLKKRDLMLEIQIAEAKAAGNNTGAERLERELRVLQEKRRIMDELKVSEREATALATRKVDAEIAANRPPSERPVDVVASSLQQVGGGGGFFIAGTQSIGERQVRLAEQANAHLAGIAARLGVGLSPGILPGGPQVTGLNGLGRTRETELLGRIAELLNSIDERGRRNPGSTALTVETL